MPYSPHRACPGKGPRYRICPNLIRGAETCCSECKPYEKAKIRRYDKERGNSGRRGYDAQWQKLRNIKANQDPLCEICLLKGLVVPLDVVHHIKPIETHPELRLNMNNLQSLCTQHHEECHADDRFGRNKIT